MEAIIMRITWRGLELPTGVDRDSDVSSDQYGRFYVEPFERGFGTTIGNSLRRVLLSSLEGSAVTSIKISGVGHEFTSIEGVMEDITEIVLNTKQLVVKLQSDESKTITVSAEGSPAIITAVTSSTTTTMGAIASGAMGISLGLLAGSLIANVFGVSGPAATASAIGGGLAGGLSFFVLLLFNQ